MKSLIGKKAKIKSTIYAPSGEPLLKRGDIAMVSGYSPHINSLYVSFIDGRQGLVAVNEDNLEIIDDKKEVPFDCKYTCSAHMGDLCPCDKYRPDGDSVNEQQKISELPESPGLSGDDMICMVTRGNVTLREIVEYVNENVGASEVDKLEIEIVRLRGECDEQLFQPLCKKALLFTNLTAADYFSLNDIKIFKQLGYRVFVREEL